MTEAQLARTPLPQGSIRRNVVLVDWESVQPESFDLLTPEYFHVMVFVGATQKKLPIDVVQRIHRLGHRAEFVRVSRVGRNALDFHIAYYIGKLAAADSSAFFHIITKDGGFDPLVEHLKEHMIFSARWPDIESIPLVKAMRAKSPRERATFFLTKLAEAKVPPPRSERTLRSAVAALFNRQLAEDEIDAVVSMLLSGGDVLVANGRIAFPRLAH